MKKYLKSGFNTVQDVNLEAGTYTLVAYAKSMYSNVYTFALGDGENWTEYDIDVIQGQLCKVWLTFTIDKKVTKFKPIANNFSESHPVHVTDLQLTRGNMPVEAGANSYDVVSDYESKITQAADKISFAVYNKKLDDLNPQTAIKLTSENIILTVANELLDTGIDIDNEQITLTANNTIFKNNSGQPIALFNSDWTKIKADVIELTANDQITLKVNAAKSDAISEASDDAAVKAYNAKNEAISTAATYATDKVDGLKTDLSDTGIDIEEGILTLYSGAKDGNAGGKVIIAGSNFSVDANGKIKAVDGEFSGKIASGGGISTIGDKIKLNSDGSGHLANGHIEWDEEGNSLFTGALASPFERVKNTNTYTKDFSNNLIVTGSTFNLPWNQLASGRLIRLIQPNAETASCTAPGGNYFYEDGEQKSTLTMLGNEIIELLGYTDKLGVFKGWLVLNRGLMHTVSTWGEPHRIVAHGHVKTGNPFVYHTFDGSTLTITRDQLSLKWYTSIVMPTKWFDSKDGYYVKIIANGGDSSALHTVDKLDYYNFLVSQHSLNASGTLSRTTTFDFYFEIYSAAWLYRKSSGGGGVMPGEEW